MLKFKDKYLIQFVTHKMCSIDVIYYYHCLQFNRKVILYPAQDPRAVSLTN